MPTYFPSLVKRGLSIDFRVDNLQWADCSYNTSFHSSIGLSPFQVIYGRPPPSTPTYTNGSSNIEAIDSTWITRDEILDFLRENLSKAQDNMKQQTNIHRRNYEFNTGDWVYLKIQPYGQ